MIYESKLSQCDWMAKLQARLPLPAALWLRLHLFQLFHLGHLQLGLPLLGGRLPRCSELVDPPQVAVSRIIATGQLLSAVHFNLPQVQPKVGGFQLRTAAPWDALGREFSRVRTSFHLKASLQSLFASESSRAASVSQSPWAGPASSWPARRNTNGLAQARAHESAAATGLGRF